MNRPINIAFIFLGTALGSRLNGLKLKELFYGKVKLKIGRVLKRLLDKLEIEKLKVEE